MQNGTDDPTDQAAGLSRGIVGIARFLEQAQTDIVLVLGDRIEAMAGAMAAITTGRFLAHIHGGDVAPGDVDDSLRNAITKMAHLHLCATEQARQRVLAMNEHPTRVFVVGAPGLDDLGKMTRTHQDRSTRSGRALVLQHPCGRSSASEGRVMNALLRAVDDVGLDPIIIYPNSDRGHDGIVQAIQTHASRQKQGTVQVVRSMKRDQFLRTLLDVDVLVGNSSCGIIESATAGTAAVNVGNRQRGRERSGPTVLDVNETRSAIRDGLRQALGRRPIMGQPTVYGDGRAGTRIAHHLAKMPLSDAFRHKC
jgi:UDP-hydrolysing UDP-N-acetyl-D-glucosamine 2-epimerase